MLRLAHRIIDTPNHVLVSWARSRAAREKLDLPKLVDGMDRMKDRIRDAHIIIADNIAEYLATNEQQEWDLHDDFHRVTPPFENVFIEWNSPDRVLLPSGWQDQPMGSQIGWSLLCPPEKKTAMACIGKMFGKNITAPDGLTDRIVIAYEKCRWIIMGDLFIFGGIAPCIWAGAPSWYFLEESGRIIEQISIPINPGVIQAQWSVTSMINDALMTLSFMNCKNVVRTDATDTEGPSDKWLRRQKQPKLRYHVLQIDPMKEVLRREGGSESNGLKKALHICRGHFATYTEEKPLFGRSTGTFWKPAHVRGTEKAGVVVKDYAVNVPAPRASE
jgi:hypothetical protein